MAWFPIIQDLFQRADGAVGNNWTEVGGSNFSIASDQLVVGAGEFYLNNYLHRPGSGAIPAAPVVGSNEQSINQQVVAIFTADTANASSLLLIGLRTDPSTGFGYLFTFQPANGGGGNTGFGIQYWDGTLNAIQNGLPSVAAANGHRVQITASVTGGSGGTATFYLQAIDLDASNAVLYDSTVANGNVPVTSGLGPLNPASNSGYNLSALTQNPQVLHVQAFTGYSDIAPAGYVPSNDSKVFYTPYNWLQNGAVSAISNNTGSYAKIGFTGTSLTVFMSCLAFAQTATAAQYYPIIRVEADGLNPFEVTLTNGGNGVCAISVPLNSAYNSSGHWVKLTWMRSSTTQLPDRWANSGIGPAASYQILNYQIDSGQATVPLSGTPIPVKPHTCLCFGDSITEGWEAEANAGYPLTTVATGSWGQAYADFVNAEVSLVGFGGMSWVGTSGVPSFDDNAGATTWNLLWASTARSFSVPPDYVVINMGTNDITLSSGLNATVIQGTLTRIRAAVGPLTHIHVQIPTIAYATPTGLTYVGYFNAGFAAYLTASGDRRAYLTNLGVAGSAGFANGASIYSPDGTHPYGEYGLGYGAQHAGLLAANGGIIGFGGGINGSNILGIP